MKQGSDFQTFKATAPTAQQTLSRDEQWDTGAAPQTTWGRGWELSSSWPEIEAKGRKEVWNQKVDYFR